MRLAPLLPAVALACSLTPLTTRAAPIGYQAVLSTLFHDVSGTVTIVDNNTFRVDDFTYDGQAPAVYFYFGDNDSDAAFASGLQIDPILSGTAYDGTQGPLFFDLPPGSAFGTFDPYNAISVWCAQFAVNFGSGTFTAPLMGDPTGDGFVGIDDLNLVLAHWGQNVTPGDVLHGDLSGDGFVGIDDLNNVLGNWNAGTPPLAIQGDSDSDGGVTIMDLNQWLLNWDMGTPPPTNNNNIPEPATLTSLALLTLLCAKPSRKH